jgi:hypothetical protein
MLSKRAGPFVVALVAALLLVPSATAGAYADKSGDGGAAGDITGVAVFSDKSSGQVVFRITGNNIASSANNAVFLTVDSDANPLTGNLLDNGSDYWFVVDNSSYWFMRWTGSDWVAASDQTVRVSGGTGQIVISVNRSELGNASTFNFTAETFDVPSRSGDEAPDDGAFNYSIEANGPDIKSVDVKTTPTNGPRAGKRFVVVPTAVRLPPDGRTTPAAIVPESYSCTAKVGAKTLTGTGAGGCTFAVPKKKTSGKTLTVQLTVNYQGATKVVPLTFKVK